MMSVPKPPCSLFSSVLGVFSITCAVSVCAVPVCVRGSVWHLCRVCTSTCDVHSGGSCVQMYKIDLCILKPG